jgi:hypothetical protein
LLDVLSGQQVVVAGGTVTVRLGARSGAAMVGRAQASHGVA